MKTLRARSIDRLQERAHRAGAMRVPGLPVVSELRHRPFLSVRDEDRVVAEPLAPARLVAYAAVERAGAAQLLPVRSDGDELGHVTRATVVHRNACQLAEQLGDRGHALGRVARGRDAGTAVERGHLEPGVLAERPRRAAVGGAAEAGLA